MQNVYTVISLKKIKSNAETFKRISGKPLIAVVKDDAYGHGAEEVARALEDIADSFAVSTVDEGAALRTAGIRKDILVLTPPLCEEETLRISAYDLIATISSIAALWHTGQTCITHALSLRAHLAVNTGMNRYGFRPERIAYACRTAADCGITVEGVYSHYYAPEDPRARKIQSDIFQDACETVREFYPRAVRHIAATGGTLAGGELFDKVRIGIGLYGYVPEAFRDTEKLLPAMKIYATVAQGGTHFGGGAGYAAAERDYGKIHTLRLGYGDGFSRAGKIGIGNLCMDAAIREGRGDFASRRIAVKDVSAYARSLGTTEYEVLVNAGRKAVKHYVE